jgi:hypothetical protein
MSKNLGFAIGIYQRQFMREALAVVQDSGSVFSLSLPVIGELNRKPVRDMPVFALAKYAIEHPGCAQQSDMPAMQRGQRSASNLPEFRQ